MRPRTRLRAIALFYALSGALGLVYEVAFSKYLGFVFGATAYASSAVLVAFMGGLALGAWIMGKLERRIARPLIAYGIVEFCVGLFCIFAPRLFGTATDLYVRWLESVPSSLAAVSVLRAGIAMAIVLVPAAGMGMTLPLLARFVENAEADPREPDGGARVARRRLAMLYGINTAGGAIGSLVSAYAIIPWLGLRDTMRAAGFTGFEIGVFAIVIGWSVRNAAKKTTADSDLSLSAPPPHARARFSEAVFAAIFSGFLVFACEVVFTHLLALVIGTSVYAFGLMLAIFLVCLSLGTPLASRLERKYKDAALPIALAIPGALLAASLFVWDKLPGVFIALGPEVRSWSGRELVRAITAFSALAIPVTAMGAAFPLALRRARGGTMGKDAATVTTANTLGSIAGSIVAGFLLLPAAGSQKSLVAIALTYAACALWTARRSQGRVRVSVYAMAAVLFAVLVPSWNLERLTNGANVYFNEGVVPGAVVERIREDVHGGVTTVVRGPDGTRTLLTNGKFEGNDNREIAPNRAFAILPSMFAHDHNRALVIGLGTGTTTNAVAAWSYKDIDVAEISPAIIEDARDVFGDVNGNIFKDPRVHVHHEDGRTMLLVGSAKYDVVTIEVTSIWFAGASNLYSKQFYELASRRLSDGGMLQQWMQLHHTNRRIVATILATIRSVFPYVGLFVSDHQAHVVAAQVPLMSSRDELFDREDRSPTLRASLGDKHLTDYAKELVLDENLIDHFIEDTAEMLGVPKEALVSTDENAYLEYATPKGNVPTADDIDGTLAYLETYRDRTLVLAHLKK